MMSYTHFHRTQPTNADENHCSATEKYGLQFNTNLMYMDAQLFE